MAPERGRESVPAEVLPPPVQEVRWRNTEMSAGSAAFAAPPVGSERAASGARTAGVPSPLVQVVALLERLRLVRVVDDGLLVLPALARYRGAV
ncbi:hypothetical protein ACWEPH_22685, partial [Nocardia beijingensis]